MKNSINFMQSVVQKASTLICFMFVVATIGMSCGALAVQPFYFVAKQGPEASLTKQGMQSSVVYLRWDLLEGELPDDIQQFNLYRNDALIGQYPAQTLLSAQAISRLYQGAAQSRRLLETMTLLKEESVLDTSLPEVEVNNYGAEILTRIERDNYWAQLASKRDFNIAIARNRGAIDKPGAGVFSYELRAVSSTNVMRRIGLVSVDTRQSQTLLPIPSFEQLSLSQCDIPDIKDHYAVALNWSAVGELNMADRFANQLFIAGYDLYRSKENVDSSITDAPLRDLANEAANLGFDNTGQVNFADLERVNDTLITVSADFDPTQPEWLETQADLSAAGLKPGDKRTYYLVARDFTGNFGPTIGTVVTVADMSRPPAPWDIDVYLSEENQQVELSFEKIAVDSYLESFGQSKRVCGISEKGVISFVSEDESCAQTPHRMVHTAVGDYLLYRFDNFADASRFKDSDGDGFSDRDERPNNLQCQATMPIGGSLVMSSFNEQVFNNHTRIIVADTEPATQKGAIYWYRLAAKSETGRLSFLSEPVRVNFPDRSLPASPDVAITYPGDGSQSCGCELDYQASSQPWSFTADSSLGNSVQFACNGNSYSVSPKDLDASDAAACRADYPPGNLASDCSFGGQLSTSNALCSANIPAGTDFCGTGNMTLREIACESVPAPAGIVEGPITITVEAPELDQCVSIYQQIAGELIKVSSSCGTAGQTDTYVVEKGEFCGQAVTHDANNNVSVATRIDCREVLDNNDAGKILAPRIESLQLDQDFASINIQLPTQKQSVVEVELLRKLPSASDVQLQRVGIASNADSQSIVSFDIPQLTSATDQWCARARIHGPSENIGTLNLSAWSKQFCDVRASSAATQPQWLSWPGLASASQADDLVVKHNSEFGRLPASSPIGSGIHIPLHTASNRCRTQLNSVTILGDVAQTPIANSPALVNLNCNANLRNQLIGDYSSHLNFIVFRQHRVNGVISNFKQVSPLIDYAHWVQTTDEKNDLRFILRDPYIWASVDNIDNPDNVLFSYVDRSPTLLDREYRYQFVYFDAKHSPIAWRQSAWIDNASATSTVQTMGGLGR